MTEPALTPEQIQAMVAAVSQAFGADLFAEETPGMAATRLLHELFAHCLADLPEWDQQFSMSIDYVSQVVEVKATDAARAAIESAYPSATWYDLFVKLAQSQTRGEDQP